MRRTVLSIQDRLFLNKLRYFLAEIGTVPPAQWEEMIGQISASQEFEMKVGEKLLYIIDRCQDHSNSQKIGKIFRAFLEGTISYNDFLRLAFCIERLMPDDLNEFLSWDRRNGVAAFEATNLIGTGLVFFDEAEIRIEDRGEDRPWQMNDRFKVKNGTQTVSESDLGGMLRDILRPPPSS